MKTSGAPQNWLIIGGGISGLGAAKLLRMNGSRVRISDGKVLDGAAREKLSSLGVDVRDGGHDLKHLDGIDAVVLSPSVKYENPLFAEARARGLRVATEIDLALENFRGKLIAVTGTNGKSTTCVMTQHILTRRGVQSTAGGNLGKPPCEIIAEGGIGEVLVLEISSYQLEFSQPLKPRVAIFTSFTPDHLQRHGDLRGYLAAKMRVFEGMGPDSISITTEPVWQQINEHGFKLPEASVIRLDHKSLDLSRTGIREKHNLLNASFAAYAAGAVTGLPPQELAQELVSFKGLPHRCELVGLIGRSRVVNDSKATNVDSTLVALESQEAPALLFLGGLGKGESFAPVLNFRNVIRHVIAFGASGSDVVRDLGQELPLTKYGTLREALVGLSRHLEDGVDVLFSPGCASFDEFTNFEARGEFFRESMKPLLSM